MKERGLLPLQQRLTALPNDYLRRSEPPADWKLLLAELGVASIHQGKLKSGLSALLNGK
jgi:hypothetical protein